MHLNQAIPLAAPEFEQPLSCEYGGGRFKLSAKGLSFIGTDKEGKELPPRWICSTLKVLAKTRDAQNGEWGRLLQWQDDDGVQHQWAMPLALLQGDSSDIRRELARLGLTISPSKTSRELLTSYLQVVPIEARARCVDKLGWHHNVFVTGSEIIGESSELIVFQNNHTIKPALSTAGTVAVWQENISKLAIGNARLVFAISAAFAPTLLNLVGEESGGFHLRGASSSGKTTALKVAASVWGKPDTYTRQWRTTTNGLEGLAALHNDGLLILDELGQLDSKEAGEAAYLLANGQGKTRATCEGMSKPSSRWSLFFLSAGEESLTALMAKAGQRTQVGQEIRLADIEADAGLGMGLFEKLHHHSTPADFAIALKEASRCYYGAVGLAWLNQVVSNRAQIADTIHREIQQFVEGVSLPDCSAQVIRVARRFALVAVAGELASEYSLTGWPKGQAFYAVHQCFMAWLQAFGWQGNREQRVILSQVRAFFESHGASRFDSLKTPNNGHIHHRAGFYTTADNGDRIFMVLPEVFKKEICQSFESKMVTRVLLDAGWLNPGRDGKASQKLRVNGIGIPRLYVFTNRIWDSD